MFLVASCEPLVCDARAEFQEGSQQYFQEDILEMNRRTPLKQVLCSAATIERPLDQMVLNMVEQSADWHTQPVEMNFDQPRLTSVRSIYEMRLRSRDYKPLLKSC